jgi:hypothetical protein
VTSSGRVFLWDRHKAEPAEALFVTALDAMQVVVAVEAWRTQAEICARQWRAEGKPRDE